MSVATEFAPIFDLPERARTPYPDHPLASVTELYQPSARSVAAPLRLTRRGVVVLAGVVGLLAAALLGLARASAPPSASGSAPSSVPAIVTVQPGDSLWTIAARLAPQTDPRAEVTHLQQLNHLAGVELQPGQLLHTR